jgi:glycosyltransferase involved in cell wall biosynthesis
MKIPVVVSVHGFDLSFTARQNWLGAWMVRWVFRNVNCLMANSTRTRDEIVRIGGRPENIEVVYLGGNPEVRWSEAPAPIAEQPLVLLSVSRLEKSKGHAFVIRALKSLLDQGYDFRYLIVGGGSEEQALRELVEQLGMEKVVSFEGEKAHEEVWRYFASCDIFVLPSWNEAFGIVYVEALSQGKAVIGSEGVGGPEDLRALGDCIELVRPQDVKSLEAAIKRLIDSPERRRQLGATGKEIVERHFTWEKNAAHTFAIYQALLAAPSSAIST